jgi:hypothetical protein
MSQYTLRLFREASCPLRTERIEAESHVEALQMARRRLEATCSFSRVDVVQDEAVLGAFEAARRPSVWSQEIRPAYR